MMPVVDSPGSTTNAATRLLGPSRRRSSAAAATCAGQAMSSCCTGLQLAPAGPCAAGGGAWLAPCPTQTLLGAVHQLHAHTACHAWARLGALALAVRLDSAEGRRAAPMGRHTACQAVQLGRHPHHARSGWARALHTSAAVVGGSQDVVVAARARRSHRCMAKVCTRWPGLQARLAGMLVSAVRGHASDKQGRAGQGKLLASNRCPWGALPGHVCSSPHARGQRGACLAGAGVQGGLEQQGEQEVAQVVDAHVGLKAVLRALQGA